MVRMRWMIAAGLLGSLAPPSAALAQEIDEGAVGAACGALEREAMAGRARLVDVVACANREAARQLNPQLPMRVDGMTTVESIAANGPELVYYVRLNVDAGAIGGEMRRNLADNTRNNVCGASDMRQTIGNGGRYRYVWSDRAGRSIHETLIDRC